MDGSPGVGVALLSGFCHIHHPQSEVSQQRGEGAFWVVIIGLHGVTLSTDFPPRQYKNIFLFILGRSVRILSPKALLSPVGNSLRDRPGMNRLKALLGLLVPREEEGLL